MSPLNTSESMTMELSVYMRNDLNMRKGKMVAQAAHAAMRRVLDLCELREDGIHLDASGYALLHAFAAEPQIGIHLVANEQALLDHTDRNPEGRIYDSGRTEFKGVVTLTCGAIGLHDRPHQTNLDIPDTQGRELLSRQWFVFAKPEQGIELSKVAAMKLACIAMIRHFALLFTPSDTDGYRIAYREYPAMDAWLTGAFGKIALSTPDKGDLLRVVESVTAEGAHVLIHEQDGLSVMVAGPEYPDDIHSLATLKLL